MIGDFQNRKSMELASARFIKALSFARSAPATPVIENVAEPRLSCGHESRHLDHRNRCRRCRSDAGRAAYLPRSLEATRAKLAALENEARRRGQIV